MWLADLFDDIALAFNTIAWRLYYAGYWIEHNVGWSGLAQYFYDASEYMSRAHSYFIKVANEIEDLWDWITSKVSKFDNLYSYVHGWIADKINEAVNSASTALSRANQAINAAAAAFQKAIDEAAAALAEAKAYAATLIPDIAGWIEAHALDVYTAIQGYLTDIAAWVTSHGVDIYNAIKGYLTDIAAWVQSHSLDVWQAVKDHLVLAIGIPLAAIAAPINLVNTWFDAIQDFFADPWGWLEAQFTDWFLGKE